MDVTITDGSRVIMVAVTMEEAHTAEVNTVVAHMAVANTVEVPTGAIPTVAAGSTTEAVKASLQPVLNRKASMPISIVPSEVALPSPVLLLLLTLSPIL